MEDKTKVAGLVAAGIATGHLLFHEGQPHPHAEFETEFPMALRTPVTNVTTGSMSGAAVATSIAAGELTDSTKPT